MTADHNLQYIAGIDIGNATTETALGKVENGRLTETVSGIAATTGLKGTADNLEGIFRSLKAACARMGIRPEEVSHIRINEAAPVIGDFAMETITETIITESTLIGHDPDTPGGLGLGTGITRPVRDLPAEDTGESYIAVVPGDVGFREAARLLKEAMDRGVRVTGAILQKDDGVLVANRLDKQIPIVDEVALIDRVPLEMPCAVEVAAAGRAIEVLSDPYGIATVFHLDPAETRQIIHIAGALIGNRSAVVIKTPAGEVKERRIPAGDVRILAASGRVYTVPVDKGAAAIMEGVRKAGTIEDVTGSPGSNAGGMLERVRQQMADLSVLPRSEVHIKDLLAVDTIIPREVNGSLAHEFTMEKAVGIASMVRTRRLHMEKVAEELTKGLKIPVSVGGVEGSMAVLGALTTPGAEAPLLVVDIGAGSTDACYADASGADRPIHLAGAGNMVTMLINTELGLEDPGLAEEIKKYPVAKVESLYHIRHEDGTAEFFREPLDSSLFARVVVLHPGGWKIVPARLQMERIRQVRRSVKERVLIGNVLRAMEQVSVTGSISEFGNVVLVGGSSLDFELGSMVTEKLMYHGVVSGRANVRSTEGPRNAVATGLLLSWIRERGYDV